MQQKTYMITITGTSPLMQARYISEKKMSTESHEDFEIRSCHLRWHTNKAGEITIPLIGLHRAIEGGAKKTDIKIGKSGLASNIRSGIFFPGNDPVCFNPESGEACTIGEVEWHDYMVPSNGQRGGSTRVMKRFGNLHEWAIRFEIVVLNLKISMEMLEQAIAHAGVFNGLGSWRPETGGYNGRFVITDIEEVVGEHMAAE